MMMLGQEQQDPYRIDIMQQAYANITGAKEQLQPTHRYMRFLPKAEEEYDALKYSGLDLFDFPLHYEIAQPGDHYHDPSLPAEAITWQYAVIPVGQAFPESIVHELLYEVFIPDTMPMAARRDCSNAWKSRPCASLATPMSYCRMEQRGCSPTNGTPAAPSWCGTMCAISMSP